MLKQVNYTHRLIELYYYYTFLLKINNNFFFINKTTNANFLFLNLKFFFTLKNKFTFKKINKYLNFNINYKFNTFNDFKNNDNKIINNTNISVLTKKNTKLTFNFFNLFFLFNCSLFNSTFKPHFNFKIFYIYNFSNKIILIDSSKFLIR